MMQRLCDIWKNKGAIAEGLKNRTFKVDAIEALKEERKAKCIGCKWYSLNLKDKQYADLDEEMRDHRMRYELTESKLRPDTHCFYCFCDLNTKWRVPYKYCPLPEPLWEGVEIETKPDNNGSI